MTQFASDRSTGADDEAPPQHASDDAAGSSNDGAAPDAEQGAAKAPEPAPPGAVIRAADDAPPREPGGDGAASEGEAPAHAAAPVETAGPADSTREPAAQDTGAQPASPQESAAPEPAAAAEAPPAPGSPEALAGAPPRRHVVSERVLQAFAEKQPIEGKVIGWNKGGFHVSLDGVAAFCPRSLVEIGNPRKPAAYLDKTFLFLVTNIDDESRRIVVSRKEILEEQRRQRREEVRRKIAVGAVLRGRVDSLVDFGAFIDLDGGIRGLVHLSELSRKRVEHPKEMLRTGQEVEVKVLKIEKGGDRISLSLRALEPDPWDSLDEVYRAGATFEGKVARHSEFGLFVEVAEGIEGLVHSSQLPLGADMSHPSIQPGQTVNGWVREIDPARHRLSLTLRELPAGDPWKGVHERYEEGQTVAGKVEHATRFGFFVEIEPGLTGLLPFSEISTPPGRRKENMYHPGQSVNVQILQLDAKRRRISLGSEHSKVEGSAADYRAYQKRQERGTGLNALAAAFEKLKQGRS